MPTDSRSDNLLGTIAVVVLMISTAMGNARAMPGMSVAALLLMAVFCRIRIGNGSLLVAVVAAVTSRLQSPGNDGQLACRRHHRHIMTLAAFQTLEEMAQ